MTANRNSQSDLSEILGSWARASELLSRRREIYLDHIPKISRGWRISAASN